MFAVNTSTKVNTKVNMEPVCIFFEVPTSERTNWRKIRLAGRSRELAVLATMRSGSGSEEALTHIFNLTRK